MRTPITQKELGLPLEYQKLPEYFDAHNVGDDTAAKNVVIEKMLRQHNVKTVLDMTCGTGCQVFYLFELGYQVTGSDFSPALLDIARAKALKEKVDVKFIDGDMRTVQVGQFDAVITIFNAVGHLTKSDFEKAMRNIGKNLKDGGIYVFDILNLEAMTDSVVADLAMNRSKPVNNTQMHQIQCSTIDRAQGVLTSYDTYMTQKNANKPELFNNQFSLQIYTAKELREMLGRNCFETIGQYGFDGSKFVADKTREIVTIAKKKVAKLA